MIDSLGVTINIEPGQQLTEVLIIGKIIDFNDDSSRAKLVVIDNDIDWITQRGLLNSAQHVLDNFAFADDDE